MKPILLLSTLLVAGSALSEVGPNAGVAGTVSGSAPETSNWQTQTTGITGGSLYAVSVVNGNVCWLAGTAGRVIRTVDGGQTWQLVSFPSSGSVYALEGVSDSIAFVSTTRLDLGTFVRRTTDGGSSWQVVFSQPEGFIFGIRMFNQAKGIVVGDPVGGRWVILKTTNGGETWFRIPTEPPQIGGASGGTGFGSFDTSFVWFFDNTGREYFSTNGGDTWNYASEPGSGMSLIWWNNLYWPRLALSVTSTMVYRYEFGWITVGPPPRLLFPPAGLVGAYRTRDFWLIQDAIYYTSNAGTTWTNAPPSGLNKHVGLIDMVTLGSEVSAWATGIGDTVYHYHRILTGVDEHPQSIPREFSLSQNYPNPFNPSTRIVYTVGSRDLVSLRVFDPLGQEVITLVDEEHEPGEYSLEWRAEGLSSGVYICRLTTTSATIAKKMLLLR